MKDKEPTEYENSIRALEFARIAAGKSTAVLLRWPLESLIKKGEKYNRIIYDKHYKSHIIMINKKRDKHSQISFESFHHMLIFSWFNRAITKFLNMANVKLTLFDDEELYDFFYFQRAYEVASDLKMLFIEIFHHSEWNLRVINKDKGYWLTRTNMEDLIKDLVISPQSKTDFQTLRKIRNSIIHNAGIWNNKTMILKFKDDSYEQFKDLSQVQSAIKLKKGKMITNEQFYYDLIPYVQFMERLIDIVFEYLDNHPKLLSG